MDSLIVVDDEPLVIEAMTAHLSSLGYKVFSASNGKDAVDVVMGNDISLALLDVRMPVMHGVASLKKIKESRKDVEVIMVTAISDLKVALECMRSGAFGYILKPVDFTGLQIEITKALNHRKITLENEQYKHHLEQMVEEKTRETVELYNLLKVNFYQTINMFVDIMGMYDPFAGGHAKRVAVLAERTAQKMGLDQKSCEDIEIAGLLHDLGRLGMPEKIREEPLDRLTNEELSLLSDQTIMAQKLLKPIERFNQPGIIIRNHLERLDGKGFPDGLKGEAIPIPSRILSVANAFDEIKNRRRFSKEHFMKSKTDDSLAISVIRQKVGTNFDKTVVDAFLDTLTDIRLGQKKVVSVELARLKEGDIMAEDIMSENGKLLLAEGIRLSVVQIAKLWNYHRDVSPIKQPLFVFEKAHPGKVNGEGSIVGEL